MLRGDAERAAGSFDAASEAYRELLRVDPGNPRGLRGLQLVEAERRAGAQLQQAERYLQANQAEPALELIRRVTRELPQHARALALQRSVEERLETERATREEQLAARAAFRRR